MKDYIEERTCPYCGAPVRSEICPYCGNQTGIETEDVSMEFPEVEVKSCGLSFFNAIFPLFFAFGFCFFGFVFPLLFALSGEGSLVVFLACVPFAAVGIGAWIVEFRFLIPNILTKIKGKTIKGTVYGYMDSNTLYNGNAGQLAKILIDTKDGKRFIMYDTGNTTKPYPVNSYVNVTIYKNYCLIKKPDVNLSI